MADNYLSAEELASIKAEFLLECDELLGELETGLLSLKRGASDPETVNTVFRAVHSIKGGAAALELAPLVGFAHRFESVLAEIRAGRMDAGFDVVNVMLRAADVLADHVRAARDGGEVATDRASGIGAALDAILPESSRKYEADRNLEQENDSTERCWTIRFRPHARLYAKVNEPLLLIRELERLGPIVIVLDDGELPTIQNLDPEGAYLAWTVSLRTTRGEAAILKVFEFVEGDCDLEVLADGASNADDAPVGDRAPHAPARESSPATHPIETGLSQTIRVDLKRVDKLVDLVSELVVNEAMLVQHLSGEDLSATAGVDALLDELDHLTRDIQDSVMAIRAQPMKSVFQRMSRVVREVEVATGKQVNLVTDGESTEVDRTVIERLTDPLTHMIRNAIDHGIEDPDQRLAAGKPAQGTVHLTAAHRAGRIVIEVADDGRGIDRERVRAVAIDRGLVSPDAALNEQDIDNLMFAPGFSTSPTVSQISGRGVGMDVVKRGIQSLGGRISVASKPGKGATFTLSLPLTLAVLDGMLVSVGEHRLIAPLTTLLEVIQPRTADLHPLGGSAVFLACRGDHLPLIDLGVMFGYRAQPQQPENGVALLLEDDSGRRIALLVDEIQGQHQVVIKSLEANYSKVDGIAAATILGDGRVALILDINAIIASQLRQIAPTEPRHAAR